MMTKKWTFVVSILLIGAMLAVFFIPVSPATAQSTSFPIRTIANLHLRAAPTTASQILGTFQRGVIITASAASPGRAWVYVSEAGFGGWVSVAYVEAVYPSNSIYHLPLATNTGPVNGTSAMVRGSTTIPEGVVVIVAPSINVNMRMEPVVAGTALLTRESNIITQIPAGTQVQVRAVSPMALWVLVRFRDMSGWVAGRYLDLISGTLPGFGGGGFISPLGPSTFGFTSDRTTINVGECAIMSWNVEGAATVAYQGQTVSSPNTQMECPTATRTYSLNATMTNGQIFSEQITITVNGTVAGQPTEQIIFVTDIDTITAGQCATLQWSVDGIREVYYQEEATVGSGKRVECPSATTTYTLRVVTSSGASTDRAITITVPGTTPTGGTTPDSGTSDIIITLTWDSDADMDLAVIEPTGALINNTNPTSPHGGQLDQDANYPCGQNLARQENITWPTGQAISGTYTVSVLQFSNCGAPDANWTLTVIDDGNIVITRTGTGGSDIVQFTH